MSTPRPGAPAGDPPVTGGTDHRHRWAIPSIVVGLAVAVAVAVAVGTSSPRRPGPAPAGPVARSSTIAAGASGRTYWLTSPDDDRVVEVDARTLAVRRQVSVPGEPRELVRLGDRLVVTRSQATAITVIDLSASTPRQAAIPVPCGGSHSVVAVSAGTGGLAHDTAFVTCPTDGRVAVVDLRTGVAVAQLAVPGRPTGAVVDGGTLTTSSAVGGELRTYPLASLAAALRGVGPGAPPTLSVPSRVHHVWVDGRRSASALGALDAGPEGTVAVYQAVDNRRAPTRAELAAGKAGYGSPLHGRARIEPALAGPCGARFADFADPGQVVSGPVAVAADPHRPLVWVVGQFSHTVAVVRCEQGAPSTTSPIVASFSVGDGARGIALGRDGRTALVDVGFDHAVARLDLPASVLAESAAIEASGGSGRAAAHVALRAPTKLVRRSVSDLHLSARAQEGRRMFADATDPHLTPSGVVACASCHLDGGDDGLTWRIHTAVIPEKVRRTPDVWALDARTKPLHWDGSFHTADALTAQTIQQLLGGDGLLEDAGAITAYLRELRPPPARPSRTAAERAAVARGRALFASAAVGCSSCHTGRRGTDGLAHDALPPSSDPAARLERVITPPLTGVRGRAPYGHDGRAPTLPALLTLPGDRHGHAARLTRRQLADLVAYLDTR